MVVAHNRIILVLFLHTPGILINRLHDYLWPSLLRIVNLLLYTHVFGIIHTLWGCPDISYIINLISMQQLVHSALLSLLPFWGISLSEMSLDGWTKILMI